MSTQIIETPGAIPPCPDCGAAPDNCEVVSVRVNHDDTCPLWNGVCAIRARDAELFRLFPWVVSRTRSLMAAERALMAWLAREPVHFRPTPDSPDFEVRVSADGDSPYPLLVRAGGARYEH